MCGIVGIFIKDPALEPQLGALLQTMLVEMSERGPDSTGFAVYRDPVPEGFVKISLCSSGADEDWTALGVDLERRLGVPVTVKATGSHALLVVAIDAETVRALLKETCPTVTVIGHGRSLELYKRTGLPQAVASSFGLAAMGGTHALAHTRMATESAVTTAHSHPFSAGLDLCLVHNGSLSNHNWLRRQLTRDGIAFETDNDSEVAAGYFANCLHKGMDLEGALCSGMAVLDGFYTFAIGTKDGFAVLRDPIACKPAVLAETDAWVAMASEYRAIAPLPGACDARVWEPAAGEVYSWSRGGAE